MFKTHSKVSTTYVLKNGAISRKKKKAPKEDFQEKVNHLVNSVQVISGHSEKHGLQQVGIQNTSFSSRM